MIERIPVWLINVLVVVVIIVLTVCCVTCSTNNTKESEDIIHIDQLVPSEQFGGATPMKIYQIFDRDTGVYYAVTEKGGICVMLTMEGKTKLVEQGDGAIIHPNQGE